MKRKIAIFTKRTTELFDGNKWVFKTEQFEVRVMAEAEGFAMVRRKGCSPFVCQMKDLTAPLQ